jgi:hypothetical protein
MIYPKHWLLGRFRTWAAYTLLCFGKATGDSRKLDGNPWHTSQPNRRAKEGRVTLRNWHWQSLLHEPKLWWDTGIGLRMEREFILRICYHQTKPSLFISGLELFAFPPLFCSTNTNASIECGDDNGKMRIFLCSVSNNIWNSPSLMLTSHHIFWISLFHK